MRASTMIMKFKKADVLKQLTENRTNHIEIVKEAQKGYRETAQKALEHALELIKSGKQFNLYSFFHKLNVPENHVDDYDRTVEMLQICTNDEIEMTDDQFQCYMRDKWDWMGNFLLSNSVYSKKAIDYSGNVGIGIDNQEIIA